MCGPGDSLVAAGTAEVAQVSGTIVCTTTIEYGLVVKVAQDPAERPRPDDESNRTLTVEGVGAYGPNQGNEANSPCSTSEQDWEVHRPAEP